jgi:hypothetical protein
LRLEGDLGTVVCFGSSEEVVRTKRGRDEAELEVEVVVEVVVDAEDDGL